MRDTLTDALNAPAGRLAEVLLKMMTKGESGEEISSAVRERLNKLIDAPGNFGVLARVRLASDVAFLFNKAPNWTKDKILPLFNWSSPDALNAWTARKYANQIGSPQLFDLTKEAFLQLFGRPEIGEDDLRVYGDWLALIMIANQARNAGYPVTKLEARSALRAAGARALNSVGHRLAIEMEAIAPSEKAAFWKTVIGPVFQSIWPLDAELQSANVTFKLVQILRATGDAFSEAADLIIPFIRPENPRNHMSIYSISGADEEIYASSPEKMLDLAAAIVGDAPNGSVYSLTNVLNRIREHAPHLANTKKFQKLVSQATP
jgi:hypothetical protein